MISHAKALRPAGRPLIVHLAVVVVEADLVVVVVVVEMGLVVVVVEMGLVVEIGLVVVVVVVVVVVEMGLVVVVVVVIVVVVVVVEIGLVVVVVVVLKGGADFFFSALVQGAVTVTEANDAVPVWVTVEVTSVIGTKEEQKAEALSAIRIALQLSTSPRAARSARGTCRAKVEERRVAAPSTVCRRCIVRDK